ncbi:MAG: hypothetical protein ACXABV_15885, partial [Candidatus Thorarchaeota archaeon]
MNSNRVMSGRRPTARPFTAGQRELLWIGIPLLAIVLLMVPMCSTDVTIQPFSEDNRRIDERHESASNLIRVNLPYFVESVAAGNTTHGRGVAWIFNDTLRFKDPVNLVDASVNIGLGDPFFHTLIGADVDLDGYTEFLFMMFNMTNMNLVVVDFDGGGSVIEINYDATPNPIGIVIGDFNGDASIDVGVYDDYRVVMRDLGTGAFIGGYTVPINAILVKTVVGNFSIAAGDEIAVMWILDPYTSSSKVVVGTMFGDGIPIAPPIESDSHYHGFDMASFEHENNFDNIAVTMLDMDAQESVLVGINANVTPRFELRDAKYQGDSYVKTGKFNMDTQEDL